MGVRFLFSAALAAALFAIPGSAFGAVQILNVQRELEDFDVRTGAVAPTAEQRAEAAGLQAAVRWNRFGTPLSVVRHGGFLTTGIAAPTAVEAARTWIEANKDLLGLASTATLELANDSEMARSDGNAVLFRQRFGALRTSRDGSITVGVSGSEAD